MTPRPWIAGAPPPVAVMGLFLVLGAGCAPRPAHPPRTPSASSRPAAGGAPAAASTAHNWAYRVGQAYAYRGEPSPDGAGAAPGAPAVQLYRYLGDRGGVFTLQFDGETATCAVPCQTIYIHAGAFHVERIAFDPDTLIGAAFTDAFNGQLAVYDPAKAAGPHR